MNETPAPSPVRAGPGRPPEYDRDAVLDALLEVFRVQGFEAASVESLTRAAGLSRSSFYGCFGSKRGALLAALDRYSADGVAELRGAAEAAGTAEARLARAVDGLFAAETSESGCFLGDCAAELGARDASVGEILLEHAGRMERLLAELAAPLVGAEAAPERARAVYALMLGASLLRKSGAPLEQVEPLKIEARRLLGLD